MKKINQLILCMVFLFSSLVQAKSEEPLKVGVISYTPPFVFQTAKDQLYGFDISMMNYICNKLNRPCQFIVLPFDKVINAVAENKVDVAIGAIAITMERSVVINFSLPYMSSYARFIGSPQLASQPFRINSLDNKKIGVETGTVFVTNIGKMPINNPKIIQYKTNKDILDALQTNEIDAALVDDPGVVYSNNWVENSGGYIKILGKPIPYGFGLGIAVNPKDIELLRKINHALVKYQKSKEYKADFSKYIGVF